MRPGDLIVRVQDGKMFVCTEELRTRNVWVGGIALYIGRADKLGMHGAVMGRDLVLYDGCLCVTVADWQPSYWRVVKDRRGRVSARA